MRLKNSIKLSFANFSLFWKIVVYKLIVLALVVLFMLPVGNALISTFKSVNFFSELLNFCTNSVFSNIPQFFVGINNLFAIFIQGIVALINSHLFVFIYICFIITIVLPFLSKLSDIPATESLYGYMTSLTKYNFVSLYIRNLGKSCVYSITKTLLQIPVWAIIVVGLYYILNLTTIGGGFLIAVPILVFVYLVLAVSIYQSFLSFWVPSIVTFNNKTVKSLNKGFVLACKDYAKILSNFVVVVVVALALFILFGGFGLFIILPLWLFFVYIINMVGFFTNQGMRYYIDLETIITPKKLEETEQIAKIKDIL